MLAYVPSIDYLLTIPMFDTLNIRYGYMCLVDSDMGIFDQKAQILKSTLNWV